MPLNIFITLLLVFLNGFFVAAEFAIVKVRSSQLEEKVKTGDSAAILSKKIISNLNGYLAATQLGITLASLGLGWVGEPVVSKIIINIMETFGMELSENLAHSIALPLSFAIITILHIVFGELAPKSIAIQRSEKTVMMIAYPLQFVYIIFRPFIWLLNGIANFSLKMVGIKVTQEEEIHSAEELKFLVKQGQASGEIDAVEYQIIKNAFDFSDKTSKQIMIPRTKILAIDVNDFDAKDIEKIIDESYSRIPCYEDDLDNILGAVYLKDILIAMRKSDKLDVKSFIRPIITIPETKLIGELLRELQAKHQHIAVVVNEYGSTEGIVTMEDILEELVGEIQDESDDDIPFVEKIDEKIYNVLASATLDDINDLLPHPIEKDEAYDTLNGYLNMKFGKIPNVKDTIIADRYEFTIIKKHRRSISIVQLKNLE